MSMCAWRENFFLGNTTNLLFVLIVGWILVSGCGVGPPPEIPPGPKEVQIGHDNYIRNVTYHIPKKLRKRKRSLIICMHAGDESPESFMRITKRGFNRISEQNNFIVAYPEGLNKYWNDAREDSISLTHYEDIDDVGFIDKTIQFALDSFRVDPERIFVTGLSDGGLMAFRLASELPLGRIKGIATVAASITLDQLVEYNVDTTLSIMVINGTRDPILPYEGGQIIIDEQEKGSVLPIGDAISFWLKENGCAEKYSYRDISNRDTFDETRSEKFIYTDCANGNKIVFIKVNNGGHTWPGGRQYDGKKDIGKTSRDFSATDEIWKFFKGL